MIDFENLPPGSLTNQFAHLGVIFNQPTVLNYQQMPGFARSGVKGIEQCYSEEFCSAPVEMSFTTGQRRVKVWVGYSDSSTTSQTVMLRALDAAGAEIGRATAVLNPSSGPRPINTPLEVSLPAANIRRALLSFSPANLETNRLAVDDIEFSTAGMPPPCASTQNPTMNLIQPGNNQTVQFNAFTLEARVTSQDPFATYMTMTVSGPGGATRSEQLNLSNGRYGPTSLNRYLFPGRNTIDLTFRDCRGMVQRTFNITYTPIPDGTSFELLAFV